MPAGISMKSTAITRKREAPKVYPVAGFVSYNWPLAAIEKGGYQIRDRNKKTVKMTRADKDKINLAQRIGNRRGFIVVLACPMCGTVVQTYRHADLQDDVLAKCPIPDCAKTWVLDDED